MDDNLRFTTVSTIGKKIPAEKAIELEERLENLDKYDRYNDYEGYFLGK